MGPETRLIGLALLDPPSAIEAAMKAGMQSEWLPTEMGQCIWSLIREMDGAGKPVDEEFVCEYAKSKGLSLPLEELKAAVKRAPSRREGADELVRSIREDYVRREVSRWGELLIEPSKDPTSTATSAAEGFLRLATLGKEDESVEGKLAEIRREWRDSMEGKIIGLPMPWPNLFWKCGSIEPGQVLILGAIGGTGKSAACLQWALHLAQLGKESLLFSFEDTWKDAMKRLAGMEGEANIFALRLGKQYVEHQPDPEAVWEKMLDTETRALEALDRVAAMPIHIEDRRASTSEMMAMAQRWGARRKLSAIFVDAFKDIARDKDGVEGDISTMLGLVDLAKRLNVPVICTHHIRKIPAGMRDNRYEAAKIDHSDLKGSGVIWDAARMVMAIQALPTSRTDDNGKEQTDYFFDVLKTNHGIAGIREPVYRDKTLRWCEGRIS